jgi:hypothetical protein
MAQSIFGQYFGLLDLLDLRWLDFLERLRIRATASMEALQIAIPHVNILHQRDPITQSRIRHWSCCARADDLARRHAAFSDTIVTAVGLWRIGVGDSGFAR